MGAGDFVSGVRGGGGAADVDDRTVMFFSSIVKSFTVEMTSCACWCDSMNRSRSCSFLYCRESSRLMTVFCRSSCSGTGNGLREPKAWPKMREYSTVTPGTPGVSPCPSLRRVAWGRGGKSDDFRVLYGQEKRPCLILGEE